MAKRSLMCGVISLAITWLSGCGPGPEHWEVVVENPVSASVAYQTGARISKVGSLASGQTERLTWGEQFLNPVSELAASTRYVIVVDAQGKADVQVQAK